LSASHSLPPCRLGAAVKVINSVIMDGVTIGDGAHIQNSVLCVRAVVQDRASLKDCQVGPGYVVGQASEHKEEVLAKT
jgi:translation initiation factor eIF-2B subunit gamma